MKPDVLCICASDDAENGKKENAHTEIEPAWAFSNTGVAASTTLIISFSLNGRVQLIQQSLKRCNIGAYFSVSAAL